MELNGESWLTRNHSCQIRWSVLAVLAASQLLAVSKISFASEARRLRVSDSGRHLVYENSVPFLGLWQVCCFGGSLVRIKWTTDVTLITISRTSPTSQSEGTEPGTDALKITWFS